MKLDDIYEFSDRMAKCFVRRRGALDGCSVWIEERFSPDNTVFALMTGRNTPTTLAEGGSRTEIELLAAVRGYSVMWDRCCSGYRDGFFYIKYEVKPNEFVR